MENNLCKSIVQITAGYKSGGLEAYHISSRCVSDGANANPCVFLDLSLEIRTARKVLHLYQNNQKT